VPARPRLLDLVCLACARTVAPEHLADPRRRCPTCGGWLTADVWAVVGVARWRESGPDLYAVPGGPP
jgi:hypothetical protein